MTFIVTKIFHFLPLIFGIAFLGPLLAQVIQAAGWVPPLGVSPLILGICLGSLLGLAAQVRGRWI